MGKCTSECMATAQKDQKTGKRLMKSQGNGKFKMGELHSQCADCLAELLTQADKAIKGAEDNKLQSDKLALMKLKEWKIKNS